MSGLRFLHRLALTLVVILFAIICIFGVLNHFEWTSVLINDFFTIIDSESGAETDSFIKEIFITPDSSSSYRFHCLGLLLLLIVVVAGLIRFKSAMLISRGSAIKIEEDGGSTAVLESAINQYLHAVLKNIDGVDSTETVVSTAPGGAVTAEITAITQSIKPRRDLTEDIRRIAKDALVNDLGIPQVSSINIVHQDYRFVEKPTLVTPADPDGAEGTSPQEDKRRLGWFGRRAESAVEPPPPTTEETEDEEEDVKDAEIEEASADSFEEFPAPDRDQTDELSIGDEDEHADEDDEDEDEEEKVPDADDDEDDNDDEDDEDETKDVEDSESDKK